MLRILTGLVVISVAGAFAVPQEAPARKAQILLKSSLYSADADLRADLREVDAAFKALDEEVVRLAKGLEAETIEDRDKASAAIRAMGLSAYGAIKGERDRTKSDPVRFELDAILKDMAGDWPSTLPGVPSGHHLGPVEATALRKRLTEKKVRIVQQPFISLKDGMPASIFVGEEMPAGAGRRRLRMDADGKKLKLEEQASGRLLKFGFEMIVKPKVAEKDRKSVSLEIAITSTVVRRPIREIETPLGRVMDPEVVQIGIDLSPNLESGRSYLAGPFPAAEEKGAPWWILLEVEIIKP